MTHRLRFRSSPKQLRTVGLSETHESRLGTAVMKGKHVSDSRTIHDTTNADLLLVFSVMLPLW